jgi:hypothetical protein
MVCVGPAEGPASFFLPFPLILAEKSPSSRLLGIAPWFV